MADKTKLWYLQNFNLFTGMEKSTMLSLDQNSRMQKNAKKEIIYFPDEPNNTIYFLKSGKIKISRITEDGRSTTLQLIGPGEIFGESAILGQEKHENIAEVMEDAIICSISKDNFADLMIKSPNLNLSINKFIGFRLRKIESQVEDLVFKSARERIEAFLKRYVKSFGKKMVDGWMVRPFLNHTEIAELTATTRQTVNTILNVLVQEDEIEYTRRYLRILSEDWLT